MNLIFGHTYKTKMIKYLLVQLTIGYNFTTGSGGENTSGEWVGPFRVGPLNLLDP